MERSINAYSSLKRKLLNDFDGTGRPLRDAQAEGLTWIADNYNYPGLVLQCPTGVGKSGIARALQLQTNAAIIVPNNALLDQYIETYPELNALKGMEHYSCDPGGDHEMCDDSCFYRVARARAKTEPTVFNPLSYLFSDTTAKTLIIDEAHKLEDFLMLVAGYTFSRNIHPWESTPDWQWVESRAQYYTTLGTLYKGRGDRKKASANFQRAKTVSRVARLWKENPDNYVGYVEGDKFIIEPIELPSEVIDRFFRKVEKIILLSATIPQRWAKRLMGTKAFCYLDMPSPIPKANRKILAKGAGLKASSDVSDIADWIKQQMEEHNGNCIVHTTYSVGNKLRDHFPSAHIHCKKSKSSTLRNFKRHGGLWIAAGASEGVDLAGELCRVNLVPVLPFANNRDTPGQARFEKDQYNYYLKTAIQFVQQCGRSTRGIDDYSTTVCGDSRLVWLLGKVKNDLPKSFLEALVWK